MLSLLLSLAVAVAVDLKIGILALQGSQQVITQWSQTFESFLPNHIDAIHALKGLNVSATHVNITVVPLGFQAIFDATSALQIDLLYANPLIFACLERELGVRSIVTVENARLGIAQSTFGGVIFARADSNIYNLEDIKGKIFSAVDFTSLGGFQAAWVNLVQQGLNPFVDPKMTTFANTHDDVVRDILNRTADVGTVRTDTLEKWFNSTSPQFKLNRSDIRILTPRNYSNFPFITSTDLYPEWPLGVVTNIDENVLRDIVTAMIELSPDPSYSKWLAPLSYETIHQLLEVVDIIDPTNPKKCIRPNNVYESVVCPTNYYKISSSAFATSCALANLTCLPGRVCSCNACHPVPPVRFRITPQTSPIACQKMEGCATVEELDSVVFTFEDTWRDILDILALDERPVDSVQVRLNDKDTYDWVNASVLGTNFYQFSFHPPSIGTYVVEVAVNGKQIDSSPFILRVKTKTCSEGYVSDRGICIEPNRNLIGGGAKLFGWVICAIALATLIAFIIWVFFNRRSKPVAASQPFFLGVMVLGCVLTVLAVFPASLDDEDMPYPPRSSSGVFDYPTLRSSCEAQVWLYALGFCFTFSALFAKVNRIRRVYHTKVLHRIRITILDMLPQTLALVILMALIKLSWTISDPYSFQRIILASNENQDILESVGRCSSASDSGFLGAIIAIQIACYVYGLYLCYVTRAFRAEFNEARYITFCMANNAQVLLLGVPSAALVANLPRALFFVKLFVVLLTVAGQIAFLFAPKVYSLYQKGPDPDSFETGSKQSGTVVATGSAILSVPASPRKAEKVSKEAEKVSKDIELVTREVGKGSIS